jgi:hypothetical protein
MINWNTGEGIPSVLLLFVTKYIIIHRIQYHVSRFEHQNILCILTETPLHGIKTLYNANPLILQG